MRTGKEKIFLIAQWCVMLAAYGFLVYKLTNIGYWQQLREALDTAGAMQYVAFVVVFILMPLNWMLETVKWQILLSNTGNINFTTALGSVLAGLNTGFISPNRVGEFAGRILFLPPSQRADGIVLSFVNSLTQNIVMIAAGLAGAIYYFTNFRSFDNLRTYFIATGAIFISLILITFTLPILFEKLKSKRFFTRIETFFKSLRALNANTLGKIFFVSALRYFIFCFQFYCMLLFFGIDISLFEAVAAIPAMYLLVTFTPSFSASEPAIRGSMALFIFSIFSDNQVGIILTGIGVWLINFVLPMLVGSFFLARKKAQV